MARVDLKYVTGNENYDLKNENWLISFPFMIGLKYASDSQCLKIDRDLNEFL